MENFIPVSAFLYCILSHFSRANFSRSLKEYFLRYFWKWFCFKKKQMVVEKRTFPPSNVPLKAA